MNILNLEGTEDTPKIILDKSNGIFEISGRSLPEDSAEFFQPVLDWLKSYEESQCDHEIQMRRWGYYYEIDPVEGNNVFQ